MNHWGVLEYRIDVNMTVVRFPLDPGGFPDVGPGGIARELRIKVGNMEPACCEWKHGGTSADTLFLKRLSLTRSGSSARVRNPAAGGE